MREPPERAHRRTLTQTGTLCRQKDMRLGTSSHAALTTAQVSREGIPSGRMNHHPPRFTKLTAANRQYALLQVDILQLEVERFARSHPRGAQKSNQRMVGPSAQA